MANKRPTQCKSNISEKDSQKYMKLLNTQMVDLGSDTNKASYICTKVRERGI